MYITTDSMGGMKNTFRALRADLARIHPRWQLCADHDCTCLANGRVRDTASVLKQHLWAEPAIALGKRLFRHSYFGRAFFCFVASPIYYTQVGGVRAFFMCARERFRGVG